MRPISCYFGFSLLMASTALNAMPPKPLDTLLPCRMFRSRVTQTPESKHCPIATDLHTKEFVEAIAQAQKSTDAISLFSRPDLSVLARRTLNGFREVPAQIKLLPISEDPDWALLGYFRPNSVFLPQIYTAFQHFTGPGDDRFDSEEGNFSFQFILDVEKNRTALSRYVYHIMQHREFMRVKLYQFVPLEPQEDSRETQSLTKADPSLFPETDIQYFSISFFRQFLSELESSRYKPSPFALRADSDFLIFGYLDDAYFSYTGDGCDAELKRLDLEDRVERQARGEDAPQSDEHTQERREIPQAETLPRVQTMTALEQHAQTRSEKDTVRRIFETVRQMKIRGRKTANIFLFLERLGVTLRDAQILNEMTVDEIDARLISLQREETA